MSGPYDKFRPFVVETEVGASAEPVAFIQCPPLCEHDFFGPDSSERAFADGLGSERVCAKCGIGAMAYTLSLDI